MAKLTEIQGVGDIYAEKLKAININTQEQLLAEGARPDGRKTLAEKSGISAKLILSWLNRADLARVKGIGEEYADLLEVAGVDTVPELAQRNAANLHVKMVEANDKRKMVRQMPSDKQVEDWVEQAKNLDRALFY